MSNTRHGPKSPIWNLVCSTWRTVKGKLAPRWLIWFSAAAMKPLIRHNGELMTFFATMMTNDIVASVTGTHGIKEHFRFSAIG